MRQASFVTLRGCAIGTGGFVRVPPSWAGWSLIGSVPTAELRSTERKGAIVRAKTILRAYREARSYMEYYRERRGDGCGIATRVDEWALLWQVRDRQARRFYKRLMELLEQRDELLAARGEASE